VSEPRLSPCVPLSTWISPLAARRCRAIWLPRKDADRLLPFLIRSSSLSLTLRAGLSLGTMSATRPSPFPFAARVRRDHARPPPLSRDHGTPARQRKPRRPDSGLPPPLAATLEVSGRRHPIRVWSYREYASLPNEGGEISDPWRPVPTPLPGGRLPGILLSFPSPPCRLKCSRHACRDPFW